MRVLLFIDHLSSGGAQRQLVMLAQVLRGRNYDVQVLVYHPLDFFRSTLDQMGIPVHEITSNTRIGKVWGARRAIRSLRPDVVMSYLYAPNFISELAGLPRRSWKLIVSERTGRPGPPRRRDRWRVKWHNCADAVVVNSQHLKDFIGSCSKKLARRTHVVHNCVDLDHFSAQPVRPDNGRLSVLVVGRIRPVKNPLGLVRAAALAKRQSSAFEIQWYGENFYRDGRPSDRSAPYLEAQRLVEELGLHDQFSFHSPRSDVVSLYREADAVCLPSFWEGFSNTLSEGIACARPVIASDVCDNRLLARPGRNGFLFDPADDESIAEALLSMLRLSTDERTKMGEESRRIAEELLTIERFEAQYVRLIDQVVGEPAERAC